MTQSIPIWLDKCMNPKWQDASASKTALFDGEGRTHLVVARPAAREDGALRGLHCHQLHIRLALLQVAP